MLNRLGMGRAPPLVLAQTPVLLLVPGLVATRWVTPWQAEVGLEQEGRAVSGTCPRVLHHLLVDIKELSFRCDHAN